MSDITTKDAGITITSRVELMLKQDFVGRSVCKYFPGHGYFDGFVTNVNDPWLHVVYSDGDKEDVDAEELIEWLI